MMSDQVNPIPHSDQQLENGSSSSQAPQVGKRELTDDEKIDAAAPGFWKDTGRRSWSWRNEAT